MDIEEIKDHIHKLKCGSTDWQSVEKLAALCAVRDELEEKEALDRQSVQPQPLLVPAYSTASKPPQSEFVQAASSVPFSGLMDILDEHMNAIKLVYPKEYDLVIHKIKRLQ